MSKPTSGSWDGEQDWVVVGRETEGSVDNTTVEIDIGVQLSLDEVFVSKGDLLKFDGNLDKRFLSNNFEDVIGNLR